MFPLELAARLKEANPPLLLDVRQPEEAMLAVLPGSMCIPLGELMNRLNEIEEWKNLEVVVYCHHGMRSQRATDLLRKEGFTNIRNLMGGIDRWSMEVDQQVPRY